MKNFPFIKASMSLLMLLLATGVYAVNPMWEMRSLEYSRKGHQEYQEIQLKLDEAAKLIGENGKSAFETIRKGNENDENGEGIFVIDPATGEIIVSPSEKSLGENALNTSDINAKAIAREAILKAYNQLYGSTWDSWLDSIGDVYSSYITQIAITSEGKVYALAIGKTDVNLQRMFVTTLVNKACKTLTEMGQEKAFEVFDKENGIFKFKNTYIFVYEMKSADDMTCLYNPNYPDLVGKNEIGFKVADLYPIKDIYNLLQKSKSGWVKSAAAIPGTNVIKAKDVYVESVTVDGKKLAVGSGVYLAK